MLPKRVIISTPRNVYNIFKRCLKSTDSGDNVGHDDKGNKNDIHKGSMASERINEILKSMIEDKAKRGDEPFVSKFSNENKGFRRTQLENFKPDDTEEVALKKAVSDIAKSFGEDEMKQVENDLLSKALDIQKPLNVNWSKLISGMKVDNQESPDLSRAQQVKSALSKRKSIPQRSQETFVATTMTKKVKHQMSKVDLLSSPGLGIFDQSNESSGTELKMWNYLQENELRVIITHPPTNYFQKIIQWTNQGKVWKFPIDNEQGMEEEQNVHFSEHIFLENHLEDWCPTKGPIRHFMELVCVGLSKNHYYSAQDKRDHIDWYKEYFGSKKELLRQVGALQDGFKEKSKELS